MRLTGEIMKIITCFKLVPEEQDIVVTPEYTLNFDNADAKISQFDLNAIEAASQLATDDDEIAALTVGGSLLQNSKVRKDVLSRGPHSLYLVQDAQLEHALPLDTAKALAAAIEKIGFDLLIFGEGSGDLYAQQVGLLVGEILQLPVINAVSAIQRQGNTLVIERTLEDDVEVIFSKEVASAEDPAKAQIEKEEEYKKAFANPYNAAQYGYIDDVIEPRNTRFRIIRALQQLQTKKLTNPAKKHDNLPL